MNFNLIENSYVDWEAIGDEFADDYLHSELDNRELKAKYDMTRAEFRDCCDIVKSKYGLNRRPFWKHRRNEAKYFYKVYNGYIIQKRINGDNVYLGHVPSLKVAELLVEMCKNASWNVDICRAFIRNWKEYV